MQITFKENQTIACCFFQPLDMTVWIPLFFSAILCSSVLWVFTRLSPLQTQNMPFSSCLQVTIQATFNQGITNEHYKIFFPNQLCKKQSITFKVSSSIFYVKLFFLYQTNLHPKVGNLATYISETSQSHSQ